MDSPVVLITGGSRGIGAATALAASPNSTFAAAGNCFTLSRIKKGN